MPLLPRSGFVGAAGMPSHALHVVQAFEARNGGIVPVDPRAMVRLEACEAANPDPPQHGNSVHWPLDFEERGPI
jgi:hypothetical protein